MKKRPKVGLAIGSGAAYGLSAIGILKVFEENEIPIDVISGCSIGAVIGALYAAGLKSFRLEDELLTMRWRELVDFVLPEKGLVAGNKVESYIRDLIDNKTFEELKIPLYIVAVDVNKGKQIVFNKGDVATAVRASMSIPGVFTPVEMEDMTLVDGAVIDPIPTDVIEKHCDVMIAIDFSADIKPSSYVESRKKKSMFLKAVQNDLIESELKYVEEYLKHGRIKIPPPFRWFLSPNYIYKLIKKQELNTSSFKLLEVTKKSHSIMANELASLRLQLHKPDILIHPNLRKMGVFEFDKGEYAMKQGELAAKAKIDKIKRILKMKK